jgi:DNA (cytosine-5)-methyltransferase 1
LVPEAFDPTQITSATNRSNTRPGDTCYTPAKGAHAPAIAFSEIAACRLSATGAGFLTGNEQMSIEQNVAGVSTPSELKVRRLTPRECERLMGFPDDYTLIPWRGKPADQCPDGPRYKALGNSWAVPVVRWIGERINAAVELASK